MKGAKLAVARIVGMAVLLVAGLGVSAALADPGNGNGPPASTVPGSPGDDCSHGNNGKDCKPDPSENGKDCDDHGQARGNEDHCVATTTTTTTPSTPSGNGPTSSGATGSTPPPASPPTVKPVHEAAGKQATKAHAGQVASKTVQRGELPFTGFPAWALALIGCLMLAAGFGLRRVTS